MKALLLLLLSLTCLSAQYPEHDALQVKRWASAQIQPHRYREVQVVCDRIQRDLARYKAVEGATGVPAHVIAGLHNMEASGSFLCHLHEGSPIKYGRTRYVPKGRPKVWNPPNSWEASAQDALNYDRMGEKNWGRLGPALSACEGYNGWGVRKYHNHVATPYLWSGMTGPYGVGLPGKYVSDGKWSSTARSAQIGVATIWKELERRKLITVPKP